MDKVTDDPAPGAPTPPADPATPAPELDNLGYDKPAEPATPPADPSPGTPPATPTPEPPKDPAPLTGYEKPPEPAAKPKEGDPAPADPATPPKEGELKVEDKGNLSEAEVAKVLKFAKTHNLPQSVVDADIAERKAEQEQYEKDRLKSQADVKEAAKARETQWYEELKIDPTIGGEHFATNVKKVDKFIEDNYPEINKRLTEGGTMLPPYVMRDFFKHAVRLHETESLVQGDPEGEKAKEELKKGDKTAHLDFYDS